MTEVDADTVEAVMDVADRVSVVTEVKVAALSKLAVPAPSPPADWVMDPEMATEPARVMVGAVTLKEVVDAAIDEPSMLRVEPPQVTV